MANEGARERILGSIPVGYRPLLHAAFTIGSGVAVLLLAAMNLESVRAVELLVVPAMLILSNLGEWWAHKRLLHRRIPPFAVLYDQHTPRHHVVYQQDSMAIRSFRELALVLIPGFGVFAITLGVSPFALGAALLLSPNAGWLVLVSSALYVVLYEVTHFLYHLPETNWLTRSRLVGFLREHHRRHHDPRLMQKWNFNVTVPLFDVLFGTRISDARYRAFAGAPDPEVEEGLPAPRAS
jgi:sterol desaturase/sphingolipid hydroxylase (fatty acid hydroxylase superfamily)